MRYYLPFEDAATGSVADTFATLAAILAADTAGHRFRLRGLDIGPGDGTPADKSATVQIKRIADVSAGSAGTAGDTVSAANMPKADTNSQNCLMTGPRKYSAEPTAYETESLFSQGLNTRGTLHKWWDENEAPIFQRDQLCGLRVAPESADALTFSGTLTFEVF